MWHTLKWRQQQYQKPEKTAGSTANILRVGEAEDSIERTCMELGTYGSCHKMEIFSSEFKIEQRMFKTKALGEIRKHTF